MEQDVIIEEYRFILMECFRIMLARITEAEKQILKLQRKIEHNEREMDIKAMEEALEQD